MGEKDVMLYVIIIIVVLMKIMFWTLYLCLRSRRQKQLRQRQASATTRVNHLGVTRYEEEVAVPQPAFVFAGYPGNPVHTALVNSLPEYQDEDPYKVDCPPPSYCNEFQAEEEQPETVTQVVIPDTQCLISPSDTDNEQT